MIIDAHGHLITPASIFGIRTVLQASNGQHSKEWYHDRYVREEEMRASADRGVKMMDAVGTDIQFLSPRPFVLMHSHPVAKDVAMWVGLNNDLIHQAVQWHPTRYRGVAGLPQVSGQPVEIVFDELERCVEELGFVGVLVNPDPGEGNGWSPRLDDPYWYPLWAKLVELNVPAHIHAAGCTGRETYDEHFASEESLAITALTHSEVFDKFPELKVMISHGGGSIPYQIGRWRAHHWLDLATKKPHIKQYFIDLEKAGMAGEELPDAPADLTSYDDALRMLWFDTDVHAETSLELLFKVVGPDRCLFGTERPGSGGAINPKTGHSFEDFKYTIDHLDGLTDEDRRKIYSENARIVFPRLRTGDEA
ncbi:amidohydrolase family protein [Granulicoccus phenolivorans]|uniref:amidohydrolase family protein n=1 Tax=Granulicoccus phenolivorans TaxID=266854 RepID=UPI0004190350|nr:amidohydrolase family protein [Granulicoccus phenolivorans]